MAISDEFKAQLKAGKIVDALTLALGEAIELEITTWVSSSNTSDAPILEAREQIPGDRKMRTRINIVDGDIDNEVGAQFIGNGPYTELRQFHMEQVQEGRQIIQNNLESLHHLFTVLTNTLSKLPPSARRRADGTPILSPSSEDSFENRG